MKNMVKKLSIKMGMLLSFMAFLVIPVSAKTIEDADIENETTDYTVLNNVNVVFKSGKIWGLSGVNESGKTMLMRAMAGLIYPTGGIFQ